jgi:hypothetical protein
MRALEGSAGPGGLAVAACHRSGSTSVGVGRCSTLGRASARRLADLNANNARNADINARTWFLGAPGRGRCHFIAERGSRKKRDASRPDSDFAQNLHRYLRSCWPMAMRKQPEMRSAVPCKSIVCASSIGTDAAESFRAPSRNAGSNRCAPNQAITVEGMRRPNKNLQP